MSLKSESFIFHIGYHKTASTFLQNAFAQSDIGYLFLSKEAIRRFKNLLLNKEATKQAAKELREQISPKNKAVNIISQESLSGHPHGYKTDNPFRTADIIKAVFPEAKILIVIREQFDYLKSLYCFRVGIKGQEVRNIQKFLHQEGEKGLFEKLQYHKLIGYYKKLFSDERVLVLPYELLKSDKREFVKHLTEFTGAKIVLNEKKTKKRNLNKSVKNKNLLQIMRVVNYPIFLYTKLRIRGMFDRRLRYAFYFLKRRMNFLLVKIFKSKNFDIPEEIKKDLKPIFAESNQKLQAYTDYPLKKFAYCVSKANPVKELE